MFHDHTALIFHTVYNMISRLYLLYYKYISLSVTVYVYRYSQTHYIFSYQLILYATNSLCAWIFINTRNIFSRIYCLINSLFIKRTGYELHIYKPLEIFSYMYRLIESLFIKLKPYVFGSFLTATTSLLYTLLWTHSLFF